MISMKKLLKKMGKTSQDLIDLEKRLDGYTSCKSVTKEDLELLNGLMPLADKLAVKFRDQVSEEVKKDSTEYGMLLARILCTKKSFEDLMNMRCPKADFDRLAEMAKKEFTDGNDE